MAFSGCVYIENLFQPAPTATPVVITLTPTPMPTATPVPTPVVRQTSSDVKVMPFGEKGLIGFTFVKGSEVQNENVSVVLANDGNSAAKNVVLTLTETDAHGGNMLVQQKYKVGDIRRGERKEYSMQTEDHDLASSVLITVNIEWGENGEYYNPTAFLNIAKSIWM
jgi:hypothetical protein